MHAALLVSSVPSWALSLATSWTARGEVTVVLLDRAAAAARCGHASAPEVVAAAEAGAVVCVHDDALRRRGVGADRVLDDVKVVDLDEVAVLVTETAGKVVWL